MPGSKSLRDVRLEIPRRAQKNRNIIIRLGKIMAAYGNDVPSHAESYISATLTPLD